ncbi:MAG: sulfotransferase [Planctomycetota bacterium]
MDSTASSSIVFIVSQPRAGSTLLQTMLGGHRQVCAPGETWLMLPLVHALSGARRRVQTPYDTLLGDDALGEFVQTHLPRGWSDMQREMGLAARRLYDTARQQENASVIIDKTPRYYWIIEDLLALIPDCKVIILLRNPLAVLSSIIRTWTKPTRVGFLKDYRADLLEAPTRLAAAMSFDDPRITSIRYEDLVSDPESRLIQLQQWIGVSPQEGLSRYRADSSRTYGDPTGIHQSNTAQSDSLERYLNDASSDASLWRLLDDYRITLGPDLMARLGYDSERLGQQLSNVRPSGTRIAPSLPLQVSPRPSEPKRSLIRLRRMAADRISRRKAA